ncbi:MAG: protein translocase subunit SecF [Candidatus Riflebacteria bacterium]|nr:protein translocase subunit SecF [Candidatus Riflebacteria bacterium]
MKFDFMGNRFIAFAFSGSLTIASILIMLLMGFHYGIDFKGGSIIHVRFIDAMSEPKIRDAFSKMPNLYFTPDQLMIQAVAEGQGKEFIIQYPAAPKEDTDTARVHADILKSLKQNAPFKDDSLETANVGPTVGAEMKTQAVIASIISVFGILLYLAWRFEFQSATGAVISIVHDLFIVLGFVALSGLEFDITVLAAILTMLGYSVNDSIVVLDRIRENRRLMRSSDLFTIINDSINQTLGRTINTSVATLLTLFALLFFGGSSIHGFALTLTVGVFFGTYSSIFIASPVLLHMTPSKADRKVKKS